MEFSRPSIATNVTGINIIIILRNFEKPKIEKLRFFCFLSRIQANKATNKTPIVSKGFKKITE